jgi:hypothetical protein
MFARIIFKHMKWSGKIRGRAKEGLEAFIISPKKYLHVLLDDVIPELQ